MNKKIITIFILGIFMISLISAVDEFDFDNFATFDKSYCDDIKDNNGLHYGQYKNCYGTYEIFDRPWYYFGANKLKEVELLDNDGLNCGRYCTAYGTTTLYEDETLMDNVRFERVFEDGSREDTEIRSYKVMIKKETTDYETICNPENVNGTQVTTCSEVESGESYKWVEYNGEILEGKKGNGVVYEWKIEGEKDPDKVVDWIGSWNGQEGTEWAIWGPTNLTEGKVFLDSPANNSIAENPNVEFNCSTIVEGGATIVNISLWNNISGTWGLNSTIFDIAEYSSQFVDENNSFNLAGTNTEQATWAQINVSNGESNTSINKVYKSSNSAVTHTKVTSADGSTTYATGAFSGDVATLNATIKLEAETNYRVYGCCNAACSSTCLHAYNDGLGTPVDTGKITWETIAGDPAGRVWNIVGLSVADESIVNVSFTEKISENTLWTCQACDSDGDCGFADENRTVKVDTVGPNLNITYPITNISFDYDDDNLVDIELNWTVNDTNLDTCWYFNNTDNVTITCGDNATWSLPYGTYTHLVYANDSFGNVGFNSKTVKYNLKVLENSRTFTNPILEGQEDTIILNVTGDGTQTLTANFWYNNTKYNATKNGNDVDATFTTTLTTTNEGTIPLFWEITHGSDIFNTTESNQTVNPLAIGDCGVNDSVVFNFTIVDEVTQVALENTTIEFDLTISSQSGVFIADFNDTRTNENPSAICTTTNLSDSPVLIEGIVRYQGNESYISEFYTIQNYSLSNQTLSNNITLYDLTTTVAQEFKITFKDDNFLPVPRAILDLQRYYISEGVYKTVEQPPFDDNGETLANFVLGDVIYTLVVKKDGQILGTFDNVKAFCDNAATGDCTISLNTFSAAVGPDSYTSSRGVTFTMDYDKDTRVASAIFSVDDSTTQSMVLNVTLNDNFGNTEVCFDELTSSSGTLTCNVPSSFGNATATGILYKSGDPLGKIKVDLNSDSRDIYGASTVTLGLISFVTLLGIGLSGSAVVTVSFMIIGTVVNAGLVLINQSGFIGYGSAFLWLITALLVILWKANRRNA